MLTRLVTGAAGPRRRDHRREPAPGRRRMSNVCARGASRSSSCSSTSCGGVAVGPAQARQADRRQPARHRPGLDVSRRSRGAGRARHVGTAQTDAPRLEHPLLGYGSAALRPSGCAWWSRPAPCCRDWPDLVTANSAAGLKSHLALGYRPRRAEVVANGIDVDEFRPDPAARAGRAQRARHSGGRDGARSRGARRSR